jgi:hypothetical protein
LSSDFLIQTTAQLRADVQALARRMFANQSMRTREGRLRRLAFSHYDAKFFVFGASLLILAIQPARMQIVGLDWCQW